MSGEWQEWYGQQPHQQAQQDQQPDKPRPWAELAGTGKRSAYDVAMGFYEPYSPPLATGTPLDSLLGGGLRPGLHVIAGVSSAGKSVVAMDVATRCAVSGGRVYYATVDDSAETVIARCCAAWSTFDPTGGRVPRAWSTLHADIAAEVDRQLGPDARHADKARRSRMAEWCMRQEGSAAWCMASFAEAVGDGLLVETECADASAIAANVRAYRPDLLVVDYLQQYRSGDKDFDRDTKERVRATCAALKSACEQTGAACLLVSAITREASKGVSEPSMDWLRDSSDVGYLAQTVTIITRDREDPADEPDPSRDWHPATLTTVKNKAGQSGVSMPIEVRGRYCRFSERRGDA